MNIACTGAYPEIVKMKIDGERALVEPGHSVDARLMSLTVGNDVLHVVGVRNPQYADQLGIRKAIICYLTTHEQRVK